MRPRGPRAAAVEALLHQEQGGYANLVLDAQLDRSALAGRDRAFAAAIFYTTVELQATLDFILGQFLPKGVDRLDPPVRAILRSALAQARYMQVPAPAAGRAEANLTHSLNAGWERVRRARDNVPGRRDAGVRTHACTWQR